MSKISKMLNLFKVWDKAGEKLEEIIGTSKTQPIEFQKISPIFEKNYFQYVLFKTKENDRTKVKVLRLFRVKSVSNLIRTQTDNEESFRSILTNFGEYDASFVTLYAYKQGEDLMICYGVLMEGEEKQLPKLVEQSNYYNKALERKFRAVYNNIEIQPLTLFDEWVFEGFYFKHVTAVRGIPKPDASLGYQTGTSYANPMKSGKQVSEVLLKGITADVERTDDGEIAQGSKFMMYTVMDRVDLEEIHRMLGHTQEILSQLDSSREKATSESNSFSIPLMMGVGFGDMVGHTQGDSNGITDTTGITNTHGNTHTVSANEAHQESKSVTDTKGSSVQEAFSKQKSEGGGGGGGISLGINDTVNWQKSEGSGESHSNGEQQSLANQNGSSFTDAKGTSDANSKSLANSNSHAISAQETRSNSQQESKQANIGAGMSSGDGMTTSYYQVDHFIQTASNYVTKYKQRVETALMEGMYEYRMFVLTDDLETKLTAEELIKQSYTNNESPLPIRIIPLDDEEEREIRKYAKTMTKPMTPENRPAIPDPRKYTTCITPSEASAFNLPQENLPGYMSSFDPIPATIGYVGKMQKGAEIGKQLNPYLNVLSDHSFKMELSKLGHIGFFGGTGQGKTVAVQKFISSVHNEYDLNFIIFDWTKNHRSLLSHIKDPMKFRYGSFNPSYYPIRINLMVPPPGVPYYKWYPILSELLCYSMGLGDRSFRIIKKVMKKTKERADKGRYQPTMKHFVEELGKEFEFRQEEYMKSGLRMPFNEQETFSSMKERLGEWIDEEHPVYHSMCKEDPLHPFMNIEDMIKGDFVHLVECSGLPTEVKQFVINGITAAIFHYCSNRDVKLKKPTYIIFEEAHSVLQTPTGNEPLIINETIFETINREARNYNLFIGYICQSPEKLPELIFDNLPIRMIFQLPDMDGKTKIISAGGKDPQRLDVDLVKWLSRQPRGMCLVRMSNFDRLQDGEFFAVKVDMMPTMDMSDSLFKTILNKRKKVM